MTLPSVQILRRPLTPVAKMLTDENHRHRHASPLRQLSPMPSLSRVHARLAV